MLHPSWTLTKARLRERSPVTPNDVVPAEQPSSAGRPALRALPTTSACGAASRTREASRVAKQPVT